MKNISEASIMIAPKRGAKEIVTIKEARRMVSDLDVRLERRILSDYDIYDNYIGNYVVINIKGKEKDVDTAFDRIRVALVGNYK